MHKVYVQAGFPQELTDEWPEEILIIPVETLSWPNDQVVFITPDQVRECLNKQIEVRIRFEHQLLERKAVALYLPSGGIYTAIHPTVWAEAVGIVGHGDWKGLIAVSCPEQLKVNWHEIAHQYSPVLSQEEEPNVFKRLPHLPNELLDSAMHCEGCSKRFRKGVDEVYFYQKMKEEALQTWGNIPGLQVHFVKSEAELRRELNRIGESIMDDMPQSGHPFGHGDPFAHRRPPGRA